MGIPCSDLLKLPDLDGLELVGGRKGLGREVLWVHIGDGVGALQELDGFLNGHELIFLTGKGDRESVMKVVSLKPDGYFLKSASRDALLKGLHEFFEKRRYEMLHQKGVV